MCRCESSVVYKPVSIFNVHQDEFNGILVKIHYCKILSSKPNDQGWSSYSRIAGWGYLLVLSSNSNNASKPLLANKESRKDMQ